MKRIFCVLLILCIPLFGLSEQSPSEIHAQRTKVVLRMIGHQVLLQSGDSTTVVRPIIESQGRYKIEFAAPFSFVPEKLVRTIDKEIQNNKLATQYIVEIASCSSEEIVYSYAIGKHTQEDIIPCATRAQTAGCFYLYITLLDSFTPALNSGAHSNTEQANSSTTQLSVLSIFILILGSGLWLWNSKTKGKANVNLLTIGKYKLDKHNFKLLFQGQTIPLTSKESDLLELLHNAQRKTVTREKILQSVWEDEGDYIGRTLDVFISKLRKKLDQDNTVKIMNIRGVGYKLIHDIP